MKPRPFAVILLACGLAATLVALPAKSGGTPSRTEVAQIPTPTGPYGIGRIGYQWTDTSRPDDYDPKAHRELMVYFWYPAAKSAGAKGEYYPGAAQMEADPKVQPRMHRSYGSSWQPILSGAISSHAVEHAPLAKSNARFPVVTFSHGMGSTQFEYTVVIEELVSHGYVVAAIEHTYTTKAVWFPDGRVVQFRNEMPPSKSMLGKIAEGIDWGASDVRFVIDRMTALDRDKQQFALAGAIDLKRIAVMGHSLGAEFAARACQRDSRIQACVDLDGGMVPVAALPLYDEDPNMRQPMLFLEAYHPDSKMAATPDQIAEYKRVREQQLQQLPPGSFAVVLHSPEIAHPSFSDVPLLLHGQEGFPETPVVQHNHDLITQFVRGFLDQTLRGEKSPLFDGRASPIPEAVVTAYGHR